MKIFRWALFLTTVIALVFNELSWITAILLIVATLGAMQLTRRLPIRRHYAVYFVLFCYWFSLIAMPTWHLVYSSPSSTLLYVEIDDIGLQRVLTFGAPIFFLCVFLILLFRRFDKPKPISIEYSPQKVSVKLFKLFIYTCIALSLISFFLGLGRMGAEAVVLPFHLSGIINFFRNTLAPMLFAILIENFILRGKKIPRTIFVLYFIFVFIEVFAWLSKSAIIYRLLPAILIIYIYYRPSLKSMLRYVAPLLVIFFFLYPIIGAMRDGEQSSSLLENFSTAKSEVEDEGNSLLSPINRTFMTAKLYIKDYGVISEEHLFDFSKSPIVMAMGGSSYYQTFVLDGYPEGAHHSSGTSGIMDPYLHGGCGLVYIVVFAIVILAFYADSKIQAHQYSIFVQLLLLLLQMANFVNITYLYSPLGLQYFFVVLLCIIISRKINFSKKEYIQ